MLRQSPLHQKGRSLVRKGSHRVEGREELGDRRLPDTRQVGYGVVPRERHGPRQRDLCGKGQGRLHPSSRGRRLFRLGVPEHDAGLSPRAEVGSTGHQTVGDGVVSPEEKRHITWLKRVVNHRHDQ